MFFPELTSAVFSLSKQLMLFLQEMTWIQEIGRAKNGRAENYRL